MIKKLGIFCILFLFAPIIFADNTPIFTLNTTAFLDQGALPVRYTCDGKDIPPQLDWANVPPKTQSLALIFSDPDASGGTFYHWVVYNIPKNVAMFPEGMSKPPGGAVVGKNSWDKNTYGGPCPPKGAAHTYIFTLYALSSKINLPATTDGKMIIEHLQNHLLGKAQLTVVYSRWIATKTPTKKFITAQKNIQHKKLTNIKHVRSH